jgi:Flp pilus assembly protein TadD
VAFPAIILEIVNESTPIEIAPSFLQRVKKPLAFLILMVLLIVGAWKGFFYAKLHLSIKYSRRELAKRSFMQAEFWTDRALSVDPGNLEALRLMAEIQEVQNKPSALEWRIRVAQRNPGNPEALIAWAKCALSFQQVDMALKVLESLPADFKTRSADYHAVSANCALTRQEIGLALSHFMKAAELEPGNPIHRLNVAAVRLTNSISQQTRAVPARELEAALADPGLNLFAARSLLVDAIRWRDREKAPRYAKLIRDHPDHLFSDELSCLEAETTEQNFRAAIQKTEQEAEADEAKTVEMADWLSSHGQVSELLRWYPLLPPTRQNNVRVQMAVSESYLAARDWNGLEIFLAPCQWPEGDFLKRAMLIRCKRERSEPWEKEWRQLATEVESRPPEGLLLAGLVLGWKWRAEAETLLWAAANNPLTEAKALETLWVLFLQTNDTLKLLRVARGQLRLEPDNPTKKNNFAFLSMLLRSTTDYPERYAKEAYTTNPKVPEWAATYAYALHLSGRSAEGRKVMENLAPEALEHPGIALYYAIVLADTGQFTRARETLAKLKPLGLLPEEQKLAMDLAQKLGPVKH